MELRSHGVRTDSKDGVLMDQFRHLAGRSFGRAAGVTLLLLLTLGLATQAHANRDVVQFGNSIDVPQDGEIHDAVCFFCSINVKGVVNGDLVSFFGTVRIDGQAKHDVVVFFGDVKLAPNASIGNDLVNFFGSAQLGEDARIGRDTVVMFGTLRAAPTASFGGDRVVQPIWLFLIPLLILIALVRLVVGVLRSAGRGYARGF
jgi:hypothetical protein